MGLGADMMRFLCSSGVFYYAGAATAAGQSYTGALLVSRDGSWPEDKDMARVEKAFDSCGIKLWELFPVRLGWVAVVPCWSSLSPPILIRGF